MFIPFPFSATQFRPLFLIRLPVTVLFFAVLPFLSSQFILLKENFLKFLVTLRHFHSPDFPMRCQVMPFMNWSHSIRFLFLEALFSVVLLLLFFYLEMPFSPSSLLQALHSKPSSNSTISRSCSIHVEKVHSYIPMALCFIFVIEL